MNDDKNVLGRVLALALMLAAAYGVREIARGGFTCPFGAGSSCAMGIPAAAPARAAEAKAAPAPKPAARIGVKAAPAVKAEPVDDSGDDEAEIEAKAPVVPPAPVQKAEAPK
ncbi:MAG TPA: hypothetical protein VH309_14700 [Elusimicrobiota bacterium]|jgi:hypothetical protein|nr:hypothetical protein [Elusimicrobiota bacterium]